MKFKITFLLISFLALSGHSQEINYDWWNNIHNWDYITPWRHYMKMEAGAMGPNALPVPELNNGRIDTNLYLTMAAESHLAPNDFTANGYLELNVPIKKAVALKIWWVPVEYFQTDTVVRDERAARTRAAKGFAVGDVYIGMMIPILQNHEKWPDILLGINLKTASGGRLEDARFTDSPGYFFDASFGKTYPFLSRSTIRPMLMGGFYVYQTNREDYYQNDAILWGAGVEIESPKWIAKLSLRGYKGYFNNLDSPFVTSIEMNRKIGANRIFLRMQNGNNSYPWFSLRAGVRWEMFR